MNSNIHVEGRPVTESARDISFHSEQGENLQGSAIDGKPRKHPFPGLK